MRRRARPPGLTPTPRPAAGAVSGAVPALLAAAALALYVWTAAPTITWRNGGIDSGELATAVATGGVAHPPGYPTYLLLGRVVTQLPVEPARALAWLSAAGGALAVGAVAAAARARTSTLAGVGVPLLIATSPLLWSNATFAEVNALAAAVAAVWLAARGWLVRPPARLALFGALLGVSLGLHVLVAFLVLGTAAGQWGPPAGRWARLAALAAGTAAGALVFGALALFPPAGPVNWYAPQSPGGWTSLVTAEAYRPLLDLGGAPLRLLVMARTLIVNLAFAGAAAALVGVLEVLGPAAERRGSGTLRCAGLALLYVCFASLYAARDGEAYLLPALVLLVPAVVAGFDSAGQALGGRLGGVATVLLAIVPPAVQLALNIGSLSLRHDRSAYAYAVDTLRDAPPGAIVAASGDSATFALWYVRYARGVRPDVAVVNDDLLYRDWYRAQLRRLHPHLEVPPWQPGGAAPVDLLAAANAGRAALVRAPRPEG